MKHTMKSRVTPTATTRTPSARRRYRLAIADETDQRSGTLTISGDALWAEVTARSVELLGLPTRSADEEPVIYHVYSDQTGEALLPGQSVGQVVGEAEAKTFRVRLAPEMKPASALEPKTGLAA